MDNSIFSLYRRMNRLWKLPVFTLLLVLSYSGAFCSFSRIDSLKSALVNADGDTSSIRIYSSIAGELYKRKSSPDSVLFYLNKAIDLSGKSGYNKHLYVLYSQYALLFSGSGNYSISLEYYFKMLNLLDVEAAGEQDVSSILMRYSNTYVTIGTTYFNLENNIKALEYYRKGLEKINRLSVSDPEYPVDDKRLIIYINMGGAYLSSRDFEKARQNFEKALEMNRKINNQVYYGVLYNNLGIVYKEKKDFDRAFDYYNRCLEIRSRLADTAGMAQVYNNLGDYYYLTGDFNKAIEVLDKALNYSRRAGNIRSQMKAANFLNMAYEKAGRYGEALLMHKLFKQLNDSIINSEQIENTARLELQYQYEKQRKESELRQEILLARKERKSLIFLIIAGLLLFSFIIVLLLNRNQWIRIKQAKLLQASLELESRNLNLEKQNLLLEKQNLELELDFRNKELATHVMYLLRKNEFIASITEKLLAQKPLMLPENKSWMQEIVREMKSNIDNTVWGEFEVRFQQVHKDFYQKLSEHYPDLTPNETKLCAFLRLNMTTKDISAITFQSLKSIQVARARLRKKMDITRDDNLVSLLQQL
ncbi:MAG: tetratricopeptide repeat protein [Bacteroidales bacterium]|nr:tetratricopeptide repeat protein [Bacteroidales bacterium]